MFKREMDAANVKLFVYSITGNKWVAVKLYFLTLQISVVTLI